MKISIDIESYSDVDLKKAGLYKYAASPNFEIILFAFAIDDGEVTVLEPAFNEADRRRMNEVLSIKGATFHAFNAMFERTAFNAYAPNFAPKIEAWHCTMIQCAMLGLPVSLKHAGAALGIEKEKMSEGMALIRYFCLPCKPTKANGMRTRNLPHHEPEKWEIFREYCRMDVEAEREIYNKIRVFKQPPFEREIYELDQLINDRGVECDMQMVENAIEYAIVYNDKLTLEIKKLTGLDNPNSPAQLKEYLSEFVGYQVEAITKAAVQEMKGQTTNRDVLRVLDIRAEMAKTSNKKYETIKAMSGEDGRIRGIFQHYGARTGRWAGRGIQPQNLPQNHLYDLDGARELVKLGDADFFECLYDNVPDTLSQLIRTALVAKEGHKFQVADYSAIEARVIAWVAQEQWRLDVFNTHGKIYEASASKMFNVPLETIDKGSPLRQKGKIAELALGYQGGPGALLAMGAIKMGLHEEDLQGLVDAFREANPAIKNFWYALNDAAIRCVQYGETVRIKTCDITFERKGSVMYIKLPSGRRLSYFAPSISVNRFGGESVKFWGINSITKKWEEQETYGGKLTENVVQAIARDVLAFAMLALEKEGFEIVMHVHDEAIAETPNDSPLTLKFMCEVMSRTLSWTKGLPLNAEGYETPYYKKD